MSNVGELFKLQLDDKVRWFKRRDLKTAIKFAVKYLLVLPVVTLMLIAAFLYFTRVGLAFNADMLAVLLGITQIISFFLALFNIIGHMYLSKDNELLFGLPVRAVEIFAAKILLLLVLELESNLIYTLPLLISFGVVGGAGLVYWFLLPVFLILLPLLPFAAAALLSVPVMLTKSFLKKHARIGVAAVCLFIAAAFARYMLLIAKIAGVFDRIGKQFQIMVYVNEFVEKAARYTYVFRLMATALTGGPLWYLKLLILVAALGVMLALALLTVKPFFFKLAVKSRETAVKRIKKRRPAPASGAFVALLKREFYLVFRSGQTVFSYFIFTVLMPFMVLVYDRMLATVALGGSGPFLLSASHLLVACVLAMLSNLYGAVSVSMEGSKFYLAKTCPVPYRRQAAAKIAFNGMLTLAAVIVTAVLTGIFTPIAFWRLLLCTLIVVFAAAGQLIFGFMLDLRRPLLDWFDSGEISKLSRATALSLLTGMLLSLVIFVIVFLFAVFAPHLEAVAYLTALAFALVFALTAALLFYKKVDGYYQRAVV